MFSAVFSIEESLQNGKTIFISRGKKEIEQQYCKSEARYHNHYARYPTWFFFITFLIKTDFYCVSVYKWEQKERARRKCLKI